MNENILKKEFQDYLKEIENENVKSIALKKSPFVEISALEITQQLKGLQISKHKFPTFYSTSNIYFPPAINLEQASSEATANYKASLVNGQSLADLTAGLGIDSFAFSKKFDIVYHIEKNEELSSIVKHNASLLASNLNVYTGHFQSFFKDHPALKFDVIYLDPSRRNTNGRKFILEELEPNILDWTSLFFKKTSKIIIKLSPLLDITSVLNQIDHIIEIHIVALKNEVKDFLLILDKKVSGKNPLIKAINLASNQNTFEFFYKDEYTAESKYSSISKYIYEPNAAILKTGAFKLICNKFTLSKLHKNTHLYTSDIVIEQFPGKIYKVISIIKNPKKEILKSKTNLLVKNYNQSIDTIKRKFKIIDGGDITLIFTQSYEGFHILKTQRI